jgi:hypothetical protein
MKTRSTPVEVTAEEVHPTDDAVHPKDDWIRRKDDCHDCIDEVALSRTLVSLELPSNAQTSHVWQIKAGTGRFRA